MQKIFSLLALSTALGCGLMSGLFFVFSNFAMRAFGSLPPAKGIAAMQAINVLILNPLFLFLFMGTALASAACAIAGIVHWGYPGMRAMLIGGALYVVGCFVVTMTFNVPRNNVLAALDPEKVESVAVWKDYLSTWTAWNHVRTISTLAAAAALTIAYRQLP